VFALGFESTAQGAVRSFRGALVHGSLLRGVGLLGAGTLVAHGIAALSAPLISRLYTPAEFGVAGVFLSIQGVLGLLGNLQYGMAIPLAERRRTAAALLVLGVVALLAVGRLTPGVGWFAADAKAAAANTPEIAVVAWML
jgi:lipopolysaccharide exporter